jgi:CheY-like chemotaxis protein
MPLNAQAWHAALNAQQSPKLRRETGAIVAERRLVERGFAPRMTESARTILVVDDDRDVREVALAVLEEAGYRVLEAATGDAAYRLLAAHPELHIDVLFTDVVMPGHLDGIDLADAARTLRPELRVLYATGFANLVRANRDNDLRGPLLRKPYRPRELRAAIVALLDSVS